MRIIVAYDYDDMGYKAAMMIKKQMEARCRIVLGLATGNTVISTYQHLVRMYLRSCISFRTAVTFNLDEYISLDNNHPASFHMFMKEHFFDHVDVVPSNIHMPSGIAVDLEDECRRYDQIINSYGGIDLQVLGIGHNGHIGFNEPGTPFNSNTHIANLSYSTRQANARFFGSIDRVPLKAITMGIKTIMQSRSILLLASGQSKASIIVKALTGPITPDIPASILQLHPQLTVILEKQAASCLPISELNCSFVA